MSTPSAVKPSWPARQQSETSPSDVVLTGFARAGGPRRVWWWNQRTIGYEHGAWCYLCGRMLITWARSYPMTANARAEVMRHRAYHLENLYW